MDLYQGVGKKITVEEIEYLDLDELLQRMGRYNDTVFRTKDNRLIAFFEHQSTPNENMLVRFLEYAVDTIRVLKVNEQVKKGQSRFNQKLMDFTKVEFYVVYNGKKALEEANKLLYVDLGDIQIKARVADIRFDNLPKEKATNTQDKLAGYSFFVKVFEEMKSEGNPAHLAYSIAIEESLKRGYLLDIWSRKECVDVFQETFCYDTQLKEEGRIEGFLEAALKMLKKGMQLQEVTAVLDLSDTQIENLKESYGVMR